MIIIALCSPVNERNRRRQNY